MLVSCWGFSAFVRVQSTLGPFLSDKVARETDSVVLVFLIAFLETHEKSV
mgnify:CR=1 FL=1